MIQHKHMSIFEAPKDRVIVHSCNAHGVWGAGIALEFQKKYPHAFNDYRSFCLNNNQMERTGTAGLSRAHESEEHWVGWLITSEGFGSQKDSETAILANTTMATIEMCMKLYRAYPKETFEAIDVYSNKMNSGLFKVPWEKTEISINQVLKHFKRINWVVCSV